jgi:hypothetical protein
LRVFRQTSLRQCKREVLRSRNVRCLAPNVWFDLTFKTSVQWRFQQVAGKLLVSFVPYKTPLACINAGDLG